MELRTYLALEARLEAKRYMMKPMEEKLKGRKKVYRKLRAAKRERERVNRIFEMEEKGLELR